MQPNELKSSHNFSHLSYFRALVLFVFLWFFVSVCLSCLGFWFVFLFWFPLLLKVGAKLYRFFFFQYDDSLIDRPCLVLARLLLKKRIQLRTLSFIGPRISSGSRWQQSPVLQLGTQTPIALLTMKESYHLGCRPSLAPRWDQDFFFSCSRSRSVNLTPIIVKEETSYTAQHQPLKQGEKTEPNTKRKTTKTSPNQTKSPNHVGILDPTEACRFGTEMGASCSSFFPALGHR